MATLTLSRVEIEACGLPSLCMRCGRPADHVEKKRFYWGPAWVMGLLVAALILVSCTCVSWLFLPLVLVPLILIPTTLKTLLVPVPLCNHHRALWQPLRLVILGAFGTVGLLLLMTTALMGLYFASGAGRYNQYGEFAARAAVGAVVFLVVIVFPAAILNSKVVRPTRITKRSITLTGVADQFVTSVLEQRERIPMGMPVGPVRSVPP